MLEPCDGKLSRTVFRGLGAGNSPWLPDHSNRKNHKDESTMKDIESAKVIFLDSNEEHTLCTKPNSNCHFFDKFQVGSDTIQLRLDWNDLDINGFPTLDADFYSFDTEKKRKLKGKRRESHHTKAIENEGRTYEWIFEECRLRFIVALVFSVSIIENLHVTDLCTAEVIRAKN